MTPRSAIPLRAEGRGSASGPALATPLHVVEPMRAPDQPTRVTMPGALAVSARGISLTFQTADGEVEALSNVDLDIAEGDFVSFIGPSGCGKTTLLRVIADLERPTAGTILINGVTSEQARVDRAGTVLRAGAAVDGRTVRGARRDRARSSQRAAASAVESDRQDGRVRHPFDSRSGVPVVQ